jgi:hypothetical protein
MKEILKDPSGYMKRIVRSFFLFWHLGTHKVLSYGMLLINIILIPSAMIGAVFALRERNVYLLFSLNIMMYFWVIYAMVISYCRYSVPAAPYATILAAFAFVSIYSKTKRFRRKTLQSMT